MARENWQEVRNLTFGFESYLPLTKPEHRILLNNELVSAFILTRTLYTGEILTMGYQELNQRDSFWTSWIHLILFRFAEETMIKETCQGQLPSGKIPTTLLPLIEREWDIDITAYFVLRVARYLHYHKDKQKVREWSPYARKAVQYLVSLCDAHRTPWARDWWADWKDVSGMGNRLYGAHFVFMVKAAIKEFNWVACQLGEAPFDFQVNIEPLWNGKYFQDVMRDGSTDGRFHEDQMIAGLWNVCGEDRFESMVSYAEKLENAYGLPETQPFYEPGFGYDKGIYHNGGIWPWLGFADAASRIASGYRESGEELLVKVATTDILRYGTLAPHEFCNGINGTPNGNSPQGWNAAVLLPFSLVSSDPKNDLWRYLREIR
jgi:hypothetical protein